MKWNTSEDSKLFDLDGVYMDSDEADREEKKYGNKTFDFNDTNNYTKKMVSVRNLTVETKKTLKSKALTGLKKL